MKSRFSNPFGVALESEGAGYIWAIKVTAFKYRTLENPFGCEHTKDKLVKSEHSCARRASKFASSSRAPIWLPFSSIEIGFTFEHHAILDSSLRAENGHVVSLSLLYILHVNMQQGQFIKTHYHHSPRCTKKEITHLLPLALLLHTPKHNDSNLFSKGLDAYIYSHILHYSWQKPAEFRLT